METSLFTGAIPNPVHNSQTSRFVSVPGQNPGRSSRGHNVVIRLQSVMMANVWWWWTWTLGTPVYMSDNWFYTGAYVPLSQWCILHISSLFQLHLQIFPYFSSFSFFVFPLLWLWRIYASCLTRTGRLWSYIQVDLSLKHETFQRGSVICFFIYQAHVSLFEKSLLFDAYCDDNGWYFNKMLISATLVN